MYESTMVFIGIYIACWIWIITSIRKCSLKNKQLRIDIANLKQKAKIVPSYSKVNTLSLINNDLLLLRFVNEKNSTQTT